MSKSKPPKDKPTRRELQEVGMASGRPWWVTSVPGFPLKPIPPEDAEKLALAAIADARRFVESPLAEYASPSQRFLADAERRRVTTEAQLSLAPLFLASGNWDGWWNQIVHHVRALRDLGRFDEARNVLSGMIAAQVEKVYFLISDSWWRDVNETDLACQRPDDYDCGCEREETTVDVEIAGKNPDGSQRTQEQAIILDRRFQKREFQWCPYRGEIKPLYECRHCGARSVGVPERQQGYEAQRAVHYAAARAAFPDGKVAKGTVIATLGDHQILKTTETPANP